jgi:hypothetical protein
MLKLNGFLINHLNSELHKHIVFIQFNETNTTMISDFSCDLPVKKSKFGHHIWLMSDLSFIKNWDVTFFPTSTEFVLEFFTLHTY